jgi:hypothetical protein
MMGRRYECRPVAALLAIGLHFVPGVAWAQGVTVHGRVLYNPTLPDCWQDVPCTADIALTRPEDWRPPLSAVNVVVRGTGRVAKTDRDGRYEITVPAPDASLMFLAIGHNRIEVPVEGRSVVDVQLTPTPIPVIQRLLGLIMPRMVAGEFPDIDRLAADAEVNRETARDILWLVIGERRMAEHYPDEYVPDYRFDDAPRPGAAGGAP